MFKRFLSSLIILSMLWTDLVIAMEDGPGKNPGERQPLIPARASASRSTSESPPDRGYGAVATPMNSDGDHTHTASDPALSLRTSSDPDDSATTGSSKGSPTGSPEGSSKNPLTADPKDKNAPVSPFTDGRRPSQKLSRGPSREGSKDPYASLTKMQRVASINGVVVESGHESDTEEDGEHLTPLPADGFWILNFCKKAPVLERGEFSDSQALVPAKSSCWPTCCGKGKSDVERGEVEIDHAVYVNLVSQLDPTNEVDRSTLKFLSYHEKYVKRGHYTWPQIIVAGILGGYIAAGVGYGMIPILNVGLRGLNQNFWVVVNNSVKWSSLFATHTGISLGTDAMSRNMRTLANIVGPSTEEFCLQAPCVKLWKLRLDSRKAMIVCIYTGALAPALLPFFYLWSAEKWNLEDDPSLKKPTEELIGIVTIPLILDALFTNARAMQAWMEAKLYDHLAAQAYSEGKTFNPARLARQEYLDKFTDLDRLFATAPGEDIHGFYEQVMRQGFNIHQNGIEVTEDTIRKADTLKVIGAFQKIHRQHASIMEETEGSWKKSVANVLGWGIPIVATVGRSLVFYGMIQGLLQAAGMSTDALNIFLSVFLGGIIASGFLGRVEVDSVRDGVYEMLRGQDTDGDARGGVMGGARVVGKSYDLVQGAWNTIPYVLVGLLVTTGWPAWAIWLTLVPFGIADTFNNAMSFHDSYGAVFNGAESLLSYGYETEGYKRQKLRAMARWYKGQFTKMRPDLLLRLKGLEIQEEQ